jgi:SAM-dependent methyltransferase
MPRRDDQPPVSPGLDALAVRQQVELELYRDNVEGALDLLGRAAAQTPDPGLTERAAAIRSWLRHLDSPEAYSAAYEAYYRRVKGKFTLKRLERDLRILLGRKTRKTVARTGRHPEYRLLEREALWWRADRVLDAGCGEGRVAIALAARHPMLRLVGVEVSKTNVTLARRVNRFPNVRFEHGLIEEYAGRTEPESFDLAYSFAVLEHVRDIDETVEAILRLLRPGGRFCFVVPMNDLIATRPLPEFAPPDGVAGHVRSFTEAGLRRKFGHRPDFFLEKVLGAWRPGRLPAGLVPVEFGSLFVAFSKA